MKQKTSNTKTNDVKKSTGRQVQKDWKPASEKAGAKSRVNDGKVSVPSGKANSKLMPNQLKDNVKSNVGNTKRPMSKIPSNRPAGGPKGGAEKVATLTLGNTCL